MIDRVLESMFHWYRLVSQASDGARALEREGVLAAVVPAAPERAVVNGVLYRSPEALDAAYDDVAAAYSEIGAKWTVWVPPGDDEAARLLEGRGHVLDAEPMAMLHDSLGEVERPSAGELGDWTAGGRLEDVGEVNDRSYPFGTDSFSRSLRTLPDGAAHVYVASRDGRPVGCMTAVDHAGNTEIQMVAVVPEARGSGIAGKLLRHALADGAERGADTATLVATKMGLSTYERAGFRGIGRMQMWERAVPGG